MRFTLPVVLLLIATPTVSHSFSGSTADAFIASYGSAAHLDQYNEWLGTDPTTADGLSFGSFEVGQIVSIDVTTSVGGFWGTGDFEHFSLWIDWDGSGVFDDHEEEIDVDDLWFDLGTNTFTAGVLVPTDAVVGDTWLRSRFAFGQDLAPTDALMGGPAYFGEVEDYSIRITNPGEPIPEPSTFALLGMGLLGFAARHRRARRQLTRDRHAQDGLDGMEH